MEISKRNASVYKPLRTLDYCANGTAITQTQRSSEWKSLFDTENSFESGTHSCARSVRVFNENVLGKKHISDEESSILS